MSSMSLWSSKSERIREQKSMVLVRMLENIVDLPQSVQLEIMKRMSPGSIFRLSETSHYWNELIDRHINYIVEPIEVHRLIFDATQGSQILLENTDSHTFSLDLNSPKLCRLVSNMIVIKNYRDFHAQAIFQLAERLRNKQIRAETLSFENSLISIGVILALMPEKLHCDQGCIDTKERLQTSAITTVNSIMSDMHYRYTFNSLPFIHNKRLTFTSRLRLPLQPLNHVLEQWQRGRREIEFWQIGSRVNEFCERARVRAGHISTQTRNVGDMNEEVLFWRISYTSLWSRDNHGASIVADRSFGHTNPFVNGAHSLTRSGGSRVKPGSCWSESGNLGCCRLRVVIMSYEVIISEWLEDPLADRATVWKIVRNGGRS